MNGRSVGAVVCFGWLSLIAATGQTARFEMIANGLGANDLSPDGRYVVGEADFDGDGFADSSYLLDFVTGQQINLLNLVDPTTGVPVVAVSDDGQYVLGEIPDPEDPDPSVGLVAGLWNAETAAWESLGYLPNALECPSRSTGYELSADGSIAVGLSWDGCNARAIRWTRQTGMVALQVLANGGNRASVVSADGAIVGGFAQGTQSRTPAVWYPDGSGETLDPTAFALGEIHGMSDDGSILLGEWATTEPVTRATKWTNNGGVWDRQQIASGSRLPGWSGIPTDLADNGTIVGFDFLVGARFAWILPPDAAAIQDLKTHIQSLGAIVPTGMRLEVCQAISTDGRFIVGHGFGTGAWRITLIPACPSDLTRDGSVGLDDLSQLLSAFGACAGQAGYSPNADIDADLCITLSDLAALLASFGTICD